MSTIVCQNLLSCFESNLTDATTTLKLKVAAPPPPAALYSGDHRNNEFGNWGFFQTEKSEDKDNYYTKNSSFSKLSPKSLELCTENLGSETGVDNISDCSSIFSSSPPFSPTSSNSGDFSTPHKTIELDDWIQKPRNPYHREAPSCRKATNFPPPLTSSNSLQVRHHREGGRLIIEAVEAPFRNTYLQAERSDGRLKLCFLTTFDAAETTAGDEQEEEETAADEEIEEAGNEAEEFDGEMNLEVGKEKYQRLSRCKEGSHGNKGLCSNWKPALWVATS